MKKKAKASFLASFKGRTLESDFKLITFFKSKLKCISNSEAKIKFEALLKKKKELDNFFEAISNLYSNLQPQNEE